MLFFCCCVLAFVTAEVDMFAVTGAETTVM